MFHVKALNKCLSDFISNYTKKRGNKILSKDKGSVMVIMDKISYLTTGYRQLNNANH